MNNRTKRVKRNFALLCLTLLFLLTTLLFVPGCELGGKLTFENHTSEEVRVFYTHVREDSTLSEATLQGAIPAGTTRRLPITFVQADWIQRIEARDPSGKVLFSHGYTMDGLDTIGWKITILPVR